MDTILFLFDLYFLFKKDLFFDTFFDPKDDIVTFVFFQIENIYLEFVTTLYDKIDKYYDFLIILFDYNIEENHIYEILLIIYENYFLM